MLNPAYNTLNQLTMSGRFTGIENEKFRFYRPTEHETKLSLVQPVFNPDIYFNHRIRKNMTGVREADYKIYRSSLVAEIKKAYFNYLKAMELKELAERTRLLLEESMPYTGRRESSWPGSIFPGYGRIWIRPGLPGRKPGGILNAPVTCTGTAWPRLNSIRMHARHSTWPVHGMISRNST